MPRRFKLSCLALAAGLTVAQGAQACTSFLLSTKDGGLVYGRTMEFGFELSSDVIVIPRGLRYETTALPGKQGWTWNGRYAALGMNAYGTPYLTDGLNEKGLTGGILYFPGFADYVAPANGDPERAMAPWEFLSWALTNFATTVEVKAALGKVQLVSFKPPAAAGALSAATPPFHYTFHDATGASIVVEPLAGTLKVYDNPVGVMTNSPPFDWHLTNIRNFIKITPYDAPPLTLDGTTFPPLGAGSGLLGIPGDPTPPSRFIRALGYVASAEKQPDAEAGVRMAEHIVNNFDIPRGFIREQGAPLPMTQWSTIADIKNRRYFFKTIDYQLLREVDLDDFDLDAKEIVSMPTAGMLDYPKLMPGRS